MTSKTSMIKLDIKSVICMHVGKYMFQGGNNSKLQGSKMFRWPIALKHNV